MTSKANAATEKLSLKEEIERLQKKLKELQNEISFIKTSEAFENISTITDWNLYFSQKKQQLKQQLEILKSERK